jgi:hypothetical protein
VNSNGTQQSHVNEEEHNLDFVLAYKVQLFRCIFMEKETDYKKDQLVSDSVRLL